jgi:hypothetical protein
MYMHKFSQAELLNEAFPDLLRGAVKLAGKAAKATAGVISPTAVSVYDKTIAGIKDYASTYSNEQPLAVLKKALEKDPNIEFIKFIKEEQRTANPTKGRLQGKNVTLITFEATVYRRGLERNYKVYEANNSLSIPNRSLSTPNRSLSTPNRSLSIPKQEITVPNQTQGMRRPRGRVVDAEVPLLSYKPSPQDETSPQDEAPSQESSVKTLTAEIFRTSEGLQVGEIYDSTTGVVYYSRGKEKKPVFNTAISGYRDSAKGGFPVKNIIAFLTRELKINDSAAKNIISGATNLKDLISSATGVTPLDLDTIIPDNVIDKLGDALRPLYVEGNSSKLTHKELIKETFLLKNFPNPLAIVIPEE